MRKLYPTALAALWMGASLGVPAAAAGPDAGQVLALKPAHADVEIDTPDRSTWGDCKIEALKNPSGWVVYDSEGKIVRKFVDSTGDNSVDRWSYYHNGHEVYRDIDTNKNGKPDQHRWYHLAGSRWGIDQNEDGKIDHWKEISAEEATAEAVAALATRDFSRLQRVLLNDAEVRSLGLNEKATQRLQQAQSEYGKTFQAVAGRLPAKVQWLQFDGQRPVRAPAEEVGASDDLLVYQNGTVIADVNGQTVWLRVGEIVRVGNSWKLSDVPTLIEPNKPLETAGVLIPAVSESMAASPGFANDPHVEDNEEVRKYVAMLQTHDQNMPQDDNARRLVAYHVKRAEICAHIGSKSRQHENREHWYRQTADSINAAVQTGEYDQGIETLKQYSAQFARTSWGKDLAAYYMYRGINSAYAVELGKPSADHAKAQEAFLEELAGFLKDFPESSDAAEALWQLGNGYEFSAKGEEAVETYKRLVSSFPENPTAKKAAGALRRLEGEGQPFQLTGGSLTSNGSLDTFRFRGKILVVSYWATWCEPCKSALPNLKKLREKYGDKGVEIVGVCLDSNKQAAQAFVRSQGIDWPQIYEEGSMESGPAVQYGVISLPFTMLVDAEGRVADRNVQYAELEGQIEKALSKKVASRER